MPIANVLSNIKLQQKILIAIIIIIDKTCNWFMVTDHWIQMIVYYIKIERIHKQNRYS